MQNIRFAVSLAMTLLFLPALTATARESSCEITSSNDDLGGHADDKQILIGQVEDVLLVPWTISLPARIDTGATLSALDARNITIQNNVADFTLGEKYGEFRLHLPVVEWLEVRTAVGMERRPVVELGICLGPKFVRTLATLSDRSEMIYPFLVGRNVLDGGFMVDTSRSKTVLPSCIQTLSSSSLAD